MPLWFCCIDTALTNCLFNLQWVEFILFAALLVAVSIIFSIMAYFYTYVDADQLDKIYGEDTKDEKVKSSDSKNNETVAMADMPKQTKM